MKKLMFIAATLLLFSNIAFTQLQLKISTDKSVYNYGEKITISATVTNKSDTTVSVMMSSYESCQAEFQMNNYNSGLWTACLPTAEELTFLPGDSRIYEWEIDPMIFGLPNKDGIQKLNGIFAGGMFHPVSLEDSIEFTAPLFLGGQIDISYFDTNSAEITTLRDSLNAQVVSTTHHNETTQETWQILGISVDSVFNNYQNDNRFRYVELKRQINYSQIITDVVSGNIPNKFSLSQNYPNPFNPTTTIKYSIPAVEKEYIPSLQIKIYDVLGQEIRTLVNKKQAPGNYQVQFNAEGLPSGVYIYRISATSGAVSFVQSKKMILLR